MKLKVEQESYDYTDDIEDLSEIGELEYVMPKEPLDMVDLAYNLLGFDFFNQERLL